MNGRTARLEKQSKQAEKSRSDKYMQNVRVVELNEQNNEEVLPGYTEEFPYIATCARINEYLNSMALASPGGIVLYEKRKPGIYHAPWILDFYRRNGGNGEF